MPSATMTPKERFLTAMQAGGVPDRVPCTPDISNYIPCTRTGRPFWEIYFEGQVPLWQAYLDAADYLGIEAWMASCTFIPLRYEQSRVERTVKLLFDQDRDAMIEQTVIRTPDGQGGGFILSTGDQCGPATPEENLFALVETAKTYGVYDRHTGEMA